MRSTIAHFVKILFPYQKAIMPNRLNNKTKMTHKYLYGFSKLMTFQHGQYPNQQNQNINNFKNIGGIIIIFIPQ